MIDTILTLLYDNLAVIPVKKDKSPALQKGSKWFSKRIPDGDIETVKELFSNAYGIGIKCGYISEGIECIDFDNHDGKHNIKKVCNEFVRNEFVANLWQSGKLYIQQTPSGGYHIIYRYQANKYDGNKVLARWQDGTTMIETRGEGGYFVACPTKGYKQLIGTIEGLILIDSEERDILIKIAQDYNTKSDTEGKKDEGVTENTDPVSWFNFNKIGHAKKLLEDKGWVKIASDEGIEKWRRPGKNNGISATWGWRMNSLYVFSSNAKPFETGKYYTPFQILIKLKCKNNYNDALKYVQSERAEDRKEEIPYIRVGVDYYKQVLKRDRYDINRSELKFWRKDEIKQDHGRAYIDKIPRYDDFIIEPDNFNYQHTIGNCYNHYRPFSFEPKPGKWDTTKSFLRHIFGEQLEIGLKYIQVLYLHPKQILPILALISKERDTGKTTFINWMSMIFGDNMTVIAPEDISESSFNYSYATRNIICIEESYMDKRKGIEKLKALSTGKYISVNQKFINPYKLPLYAKIIMTSNDENRFIKIEDEEIRFFIRKLYAPKIKNTNIEDDLLKEIPAFLAHLLNMPPVDFSKSRMIFTAEELNNDNLSTVKEESKSQLYKDIREYISDKFNNLNYDELKATPRDLKEVFFERDSRITVNYIRKVLKEEFKMKPVEKVERYYILGDYQERIGAPFVFLRKDYTGGYLYDNNTHDMPF